MLIAMSPLGVTVPLGQYLSIVPLQKCGMKNIEDKTDNCNLRSNTKATCCSKVNDAFGTYLLYISCTGPTALNQVHP